jgi:hypothetical protein
MRHIADTIGGSEELVLASACLWLLAAIALHAAARRVLARRIERRRIAIEELHRQEAAR